MEKERESSLVTENGDDENDAEVEMETEKLKHTDSPPRYQTYEGNDCNSPVQDLENGNTELAVRSRSPRSFHGEVSRPSHQEVSESESSSDDGSGDSDPEYKPSEKEVVKDQVQRKKYQSTKSKIAPFLPEHQLWQWYGKGCIRTRAKGRGKKAYFKTIVRGEEMINVGDCAVFLSVGQPDQPYVGRIERMWEFGGNMVVRVTWFYHPEETKGLESTLPEPKGALFKSPHTDENDVQTISHKCDVIPFPEYLIKLRELEEKHGENYENFEIYYLAGSYNPTNEHLTLEPDVSSD